MMGFDRPLPGNGKKMLGRLIIITFILLFSASIQTATGQPDRIDAQGQGRRYGRDSRLAATYPNIYRAPLPASVNGSIWNREKLEGKIIILNFWATWCAPCLNQIPQVKKLYDRYSRDDLLLLGANLDTGGNRSLRRWLQLNRNRITWPQLFNRGGFNGELPSCYEIKDIPEMLIFNRQGELVYRCHSAESTEAAVRELMEGE